MQVNEEAYIKGRGAQLNTHNKFLKNSYVTEHIEGLDEEYHPEGKTQLFYENARKIVNRVESPDIPGMYSMNPYQGCEHGCIYCYARNAHEYWGFSAGLDFEQKIVVKQNAAELLKKQFESKKWEVAPIMFSGNTDCYQPTERRLKITRSMLEVCLEYKHPVSMITKNALITRDLDILTEMAKQNLVHVMVSITSLDEDLRLLMEPRTATAKQRLKTVETLVLNGIQTGVMVAPIIPGLNSDEIPKIIKAAAEHGAHTAGYTIVRLNGAIKDIFHDWLYKSFPDRADKVWNQICDCHGGDVEDKQWGRRMRGSGNIADMINQLFVTAKKKHLPNTSFSFNTSAFQRPPKGQLSLF